MKLQHLPIGSRFEYEGEIYVKTGPMTAASERGGQKLIPRYASLRPLDGAASEGPRNARKTLDPLRVKAAFDEYHAACCAVLGAPSSERLAPLRQHFLASLGLPD